MNKVLKKAIPLTIAATMVNVAPVLAYDKDETVYTKVDRNGKVKYQVVSEQLKSSKKEKIKDYSDLKSIKNISGNEKYKKDGNNITWSSKGEDIFYQGKTTKELPIKVDTSYKIDGVEVDPKDASGRKGHVEISFKYTNTDAHQYNGKTLYTPFTIALGTTLSSDHNSNVTINNGKVINNGKSNIIVGLATPGLYESLDLDQLKDFNEIKISFDTTDFDLGSFYSVATPKLVDAKDVDDVFDEIDGSFDSVDELKDATDQLVQGSKTLADGTKTFNSGLVQANSGANQLKINSNSLRSGANQLSSGLSTLSNGSNSLASGIQKLADGSKSLNSGLKSAKDGADKITSNNSTLKNGTAEMRSSLKNAAYQQVAYGLQASAGSQYYKTMDTQLAAKDDGTAETGAELLDKIQKAAGATGANEALKTQKTALESQKSSAASQAKTVAEGDAKDKAVKGNSTLSGLGITSYATLETVIANTTDVTTKQALKSAKTQIDTVANVAGEAAYSATASTFDGIIKNINDTLGGDENTDGSNKKVDTLVKDATTYSNGLKTGQEGTVAKYLLTTDTSNITTQVGQAYTAYKNGQTPDSSYAIVYRLMQQNGLFDQIDKTLKNAEKLLTGVDNYADATAQLSAGLNQLYTGSSTLKNGLDQVNDNVPTLKNGISRLVSGSSTLAKGTTQYTNGVDSLANGVNQLTSAFSQIVDGSAKLSSGMSEYKTSGIDKLTEVADTLNGDSETVKQLTHYADDYNYTETNNDANYTTKFVYVIQE